MELFKSKVRNVGTSLGVLLPSEIVRTEGLEEGEEIELVLMKKNKALLNKTFGSIKNPRFKFERDKKLRI